MFMGDVGSQTIGFLIAASPFALSTPDRRQMHFVVALTCWFILSDATFTLLRRLWRRQNIFLGHREHLYQRLAATGLSHAQVVSILALGSILLSMLAVISMHLKNEALQWLSLCLGLFAFAVYVMYTRHREEQASNTERSSGPSVGGDAQSTIPR